MMAHGFSQSDCFMNYLPLSGQSQENLCIAHKRAAVRPAYRG
jgi:hypothetical protein